jgi:hypothetical protein
MGATQGAKSEFDASRFFKKFCVGILDPAIVRFPGMRLSQSALSHDALCGQKPQKTKLCESAEDEYG